MAPGTNLSVLAHENTLTNPHTLPQKNPQAQAQPSVKGASILDPSLVTQDFDQLRFEAAAAQQLSTTNGSTPPQYSTLLISSPYNNPDHYLDLTTLSTPDLIFAKALTALKPEQPDYATAPYISSLNFSSTVVPLVKELAAAENFAWKEHSFYVVIFRSKLKEDIDNDRLYLLDYESHREACESGGLLKYWFGKTDGERRNLATCEYLPLYLTLFISLIPRDMRGL